MNHRPSRWQTIPLILALVALPLVASAGWAQAQVPDPQKVLLRAGNAAARDALVVRGARLVADYGAFSLWLAPGSSLLSGGVAWPDAPIAGHEALSVHPEFDQLLLRHGPLDTSSND